MISQVKFGKQVLARVYDFANLSFGTFPVTSPQESLQVLLMKRQKGHVVTKHMHKKIKKFTEQPAEALVVIKGLLTAKIFNRQGKFIKQVKVKPGQCLLIIDGAHEVTITKSALIFAFKDGPFVEDKIILK
jgi:anti-sigma factor ChrR (cupin superfamily)